MIRIGIDFGGTKIEAAALDEDGAYLHRLRLPNPGDYDAALATVGTLVAELEAAVGAGGTVGVGAPGSPSPRTGLMRNANSTYLNGRRFAEDLSIALERPVRLANDANCLALSEAVDGAGQGSRSVFAVVIGTGCGGGLAIDQRLVEGADGIAGEWGHVPLPWTAVDEYPGAACWCGHHGCIETWVSGTGFARDHQARSGRSPGGEAIIAAARAGDGHAAASLDRYVDRLGRALAMLVNVLDPDCFVLGGGMSNVTELYERLPAVIRRHAFSDGWDGRIVPARWGDSSGVRGAARLWGS